MTKNDAVERANKRCVAGCQHYDGGEVRHHADCPYYPESFSKMYDDLQALQTSRPDAGGLDSPELLEKLAAIEHARWARWYIWQQTNDTPENRTRWGIQAITLYSGLTEREKESDRKEVREYLEVIRAALKSGDKGRWQDKYGYMPVGEAIEHAHVMREKYLAEHDGDEPATAEIVRWYCSEAHRLSKSFAPPTSEGV